MNNELKKENIMIPLLEVNPMTICQRKWYLQHKDIIPASNWVNVNNIY